MKKIKTGNILISEPFLDDPNFKRSVVLIADHTPKEGTVGFVLNRKLEIRISDLIEDLQGFNADVFEGGPVGADTSLDDLFFLIKSKFLKEDEVRFFLGYSGWDQGQLIEEFKQNTWIQSEMDPNFIFNPTIQDLWKLTLDLKGGHYSALAEIQLDVISN